jgi:hypothetical protein
VQDAATSASLAAALAKSKAEHEAYVGLARERVGALYEVSLSQSTTTTHPPTHQPPTHPRTHQPTSQPLNQPTQPAQPANPPTHQPTTPP